MKRRLLGLFLILSLTVSTRNSYAQEIPRTQQKELEECLSWVSKDPYEAERCLKKLNRYKGNKAYFERKVGEEMNNYWQKVNIELFLFPLLEGPIDFKVGFDKYPCLENSFPLVRNIQDANRHPYSLPLYCPKDKENDGEYLNIELRSPDLSVHKTKVYLHPTDLYSYVEDGRPEKRMVKIFLPISPQNIEFQNNEIIVCIDKSGSMKKTNPNTLLQKAEEIVSEIKNLPEMHNIKIIEKPIETVDVTRFEELFNEISKEMINGNSGTDIEPKSGTRLIRIILISDGNPSFVLGDELVTPHKKRMDKKRFIARKYLENLKLFQQLLDETVIQIDKDDPDLACFVDTIENKDDLQVILEGMDISPKNIEFIMNNWKEKYFLAIREALWNLEEIMYKNFSHPCPIIITPLIFEKDIYDNRINDIYFSFWRDLARYSGGYFLSHNPVKLNGGNSSDIARNIMVDIQQYWNIDLKDIEPITDNDQVKIDMKITFPTPSVLKTDFKYLYTPPNLSFAPYGIPIASYRDMINRTENPFSNPLNWSNLRLYTKSDAPNMTLLLEKNKTGNITIKAEQLSGLPMVSHSVDYGWLKKDEISIENNVDFIPYGGMSNDEFLISLSFPDYIVKEKAMIKDAILVTNIFAGSNMKNSPLLQTINWELHSCENGKITFKMDKKYLSMGHKWLPLTATGVFLTPSKNPAVANKICIFDEIPVVWRPWRWTILTIASIMVVLSSLLFFSWEASKKYKKIFWSLNIIIFASLPHLIIPKLWSEFYILLLWITIPPILPIIFSAIFLIHRGQTTGEYGQDHIVLYKYFYLVPLISNFLIVIICFADNYTPFISFLYNVVFFASIGVIISSLMSMLGSINISR